MEAGKVSLDDPVSTHVDPLLLKLANTSIVGLWGATAGKVTVGHLLQEDVLGRLGTLSVLRLPSMILVIVSTRFAPRKGVSPKSMS